LVRSRSASKSWTIQFIFAAGKTPELDLPAFEFSLADTANPLIVERIPSPESIYRAQYREPIVECDVRDHNKKTPCSLHGNKQSGRWMIV
jgi:hypothetical protein